MGRAAEILKVSFEFSSKIGVREQPFLSADKESSVGGLYVVGDLADAPIIKVALNQGYEVAERLADQLKDTPAPEGVLDVVVIGAGPAGIGAALALTDKGASYVLLEKERPFNTIQNFPKAKLIFSEPRAMENKGNFWFDDAQKEELIDRWDEALDQRALLLHQPEEVVSIEKGGGLFTVTTKVGDEGLDDGHHLEGDGHSAEPGAKNTYRARRVILAIGRRGSVNKLKIPGEDKPKVAYALKDPDEHKGKRLLIIGGGDSAVEAAVACADAGADVTISYRQDAFSRAKVKNQERIQARIAAGKIKAELSTNPERIDDDLVVLKRGDERIEVKNDEVMIFAGTRLPTAFLKRIGLRMEGELTGQRITWITSFALMTYLFYCLKAKRPFFPFGEGDLLGWLPGALKADLGWRAVDGSFWGTVLYSVLILGFGIKAYKKYPLPEQKTRYISLVTYQLLFLFAIPELLAPLVIDRPWKVYSAVLPWPLGYYGLIDAPSWVGADGGLFGDQTTTAVVWLAIGAFASFVAMPLYVRSQGTRFCSYLCGCGGLAETLGDQWRHLAPRGLTSYKAEWAGKLIFVACVATTLLILNDAWQFWNAGALFNTKEFASHWYALVVDFWLASVVGVAFYPYLGNRVWCRFFCPLRAYMEVLSKFISKITIKANDKCIGCGECTRYCQMGIPVQQFAQKREDMDNTNSSCIQCGICIQVCPMEVLSIGERAR